MDDSVVMEIAKSFKNVTENVSGLGFGKVAFALYKVTNRASSTQFEDHVSVVGIFKEIEELKDVRVIQGPLDCNLTSMLLHYFWLLEAFPRCSLQSEVLAIFIRDAVDCCKSTVSQLFIPPIDVNSSIRMFPGDCQWHRNAHTRHEMEILNVLTVCTFTIKYKL